MRVMQSNIGRVQINELPVPAYYYLSLFSTHNIIIIISPSLSHHSSTERYKYLITLFMSVRPMLIGRLYQGMDFIGAKAIQSSITNINMMTQHRREKIFCGC